MKNLIKLLLILLPGVAQAQQPDSIKIEELNLDSIFSPKTGTFVLYNLNTDTYSVYNKNRAEEYFPAHSTVKMLCSIAALEQNVVKETDYVTWDSSKYKKQDWWVGEPYKHWTENQNIVSALKYSINWYYIDLLKKMDMQKAKKLFDRMDFGMIPDTLHPFYFAISNQVYTNAFKEANFLGRLYQHKLDISNETDDIIIKALLTESDINYNLYSKTGAGDVNSGKAIGWIVGIIEKQNNKYVFALNIEESKSDTPPMIQNDLHNRLNRILIGLHLDR